MGPYQTLPHHCRERWMTPQSKSQENLGLGNADTRYAYMTLQSCACTGTVWQKQQCTYLTEMWLRLKASKSFREMAWMDVLNEGNLWCDHSFLLPKWAVFNLWELCAGVCEKEMVNNRMNRTVWQGCWALRLKPQGYRGCLKSSVRVNESTVDWVFSLHAINMDLIPRTQNKGHIRTTRAQSQE